MIHIANFDYKIEQWPHKMEGVERGTVLAKLLGGGMKKTLENKVIVRLPNKRSYGVIA